jgi:hypothetical protein
MKFLPTDKYSHPIAGGPVRMAMDSVARFRPYGRDADPDPATVLMTMFDSLLGSDHPRRQDVEQLLNDCVQGADEDLTPEERREEQEALRAEDRAGMSARDRRTAKDARKAARDAMRAHDRRSRGASDAWNYSGSSLDEMFPDAARIRQSY